MKPRHLALLALGLTALVGLAKATETTRVYRQGGSSATITQDGGGSTMVRRTVRGPNRQTNVQQQGGNRAVITQRSRTDMGSDIGSSMAGFDPGLGEDGPEAMAGGDVGRVQVTIALSPEDEAELRRLALDEDTSVQALVEEAIQDYLDCSW